MRTPPTDQAIMNQNDNAELPSAKDHPTFQRALALAHKGLLSDREGVERRVVAIMDHGVEDPAEAEGIALAELAQSAYDDAVENLSSQCTRRVRVEYTVEGDNFIDDARRRMLSKTEGVGPLMAVALEDARHDMPREVRAKLDFGCREDGLIFGRARHLAIEGSFSGLQERVVQALLDAVLEEAAEKLQPMSDDELQAQRPALVSIARHALPSDETSITGRPLAATIEDICDRLSRLERVDFCADTESWHTLSGEQASARLRQISAEANAERPHAAGLSKFLISMGV